MRALVTRFFILNGKHYNTGDVLDGSDPALTSGLSHCLAVELDAKDIEERAEKLVSKLAPKPKK